MDPIASLGGSSSVATQSAVMQGLGGLDGDDFMTLLVTQLRYQDPLAPTDTEGLLQNTAMLAQTEMLTQVSQMQQQLLGLQRATMATDLIGVHVEGMTETGEQIAGAVEAVTFSSAGPVLQIDGRELGLDDATSIGGSATAPVEQPTGPVDSEPWTPTPPAPVAAIATTGPWTAPVGAPTSFSITTPDGARVPVTLEEGTRAAEAVGRIRAALAAARDVSLTVSTTGDLAGPLTFASVATGADVTFTISGLGPAVDGTHRGRAGATEDSPPPA